MWRAIAFRWIGALVEPPIARVDADRVDERLARQDVATACGRRATISTICLPVR